MEKIAVIGLGLIGGSMAFDLKERGDYEIIGFDKNEDHIHGYIHECRQTATHTTKQTDKLTHRKTRRDNKDIFEFEKI